MPPSKKYNRVYELLVKDEDDLTGQIAYAIYKQHKTEKVKRFIAANGRPPEKVDLEDFIENAASPNQLRFYRERAVSLVQGFLQRSIAEHVQEIDNRLKENYDQKIADILRRIEPRGFMYGVWQSVFASFIFFAAGILLLLATGGWGRIGKALIELGK